MSTNKLISDWKNVESLKSLTILTGFSMETLGTLTHTRSHANAPIQTLRVTDCCENRNLISTQITYKTIYGMLSKSI